jgi:hypothetical protein
VFVFYEYSALLNIYNCATEKEKKEQLALPTQFDENKLTK